MQPFAAALPDETFPVRAATRKSWKPSPGLAASHPLQPISWWAQLQGYELPGGPGWGICPCWVLKAGLINERHTLCGERRSLPSPSGAAMLLWCPLSRPLAGLECEATANDLKPHIWKQYGFIVSTVVFFFPLEYYLLSICLSTIPAIKPKQFNAFLGERHDLSSLHWGESCALFVWPSMQLSPHLRLRFRRKFS